MLPGREQRLEALEAFPEVVRSHEPALEEHVERPVDGGRANAQALLTKATLDADDRKMLPTGKDCPGNHVALTGDREVSLAQPAVKPVE